MIPALILGPVAGVVLDRVQRKTVLVVSDISRAVAGLIAACALYGGRFGLIHVYGWMTLSGIVRAFYDPATNALIPTVVSKESIQPANAVHTLGKNTAMILAPGLGLATRLGNLTLCSGALVSLAAFMRGSTQPLHEDRAGRCSPGRGSLEGSCPTRQFRYAPSSWR